MKKFFGVLFILFTIALFAVVICHIWGISLISWQDILRSSATLVLLAVLVVVISIMYFLFFKKWNK
ncbi:MAG: hypothetical protein LBE82_08455 [Chitinophagaceae bacterium]|jgi:hypothetical protein|nr:hypothetical protein [Chitinophagaceae bacterium]